MKTARQLLGFETEWAIVTEEGKIIKRFRCKSTATNSLSNLQAYKTEKLTIVEVDRE